MYIVIQVETEQILKFKKIPKHNIVVKINKYICIMIKLVKADKGTLFVQLDH